MTAEAFALLVAIAVPVATLLVMVSLIAAVKDLERSRDELIELRGSGR